MQSQERPPTEVIAGNAVVAGYFEQGALRPVTFAEFVRIVEENPDANIPAYLQMEPGFLGMMVMVDLQGIGPSVAIPKFVNLLKGLF